MCKNAKTKKQYVVPCYLWLLVFPPLFLGTFPIWFKTSTLKENCLSNYCWGKKTREKNNISPFPATHTYIKLTFVSFFFNFFFAPFPYSQNWPLKDIEGHLCLPTSLSGDHFMCLGFNHKMSAGKVLFASLSCIILHRKHQLQSAVQG